MSSSCQQEDFLQPLTPNQMLLGHSSQDSLPIEYDESEKFCQRVAYVGQVEKVWWRNWIQEVLPTLLPARKWKHRSSNLGVGDIVMLTYQGNFKDDYRLARVMEIYPDKDKLVRNVLIKYRKRNARESRLKCKGNMVEEKVAVQTLVLLEPSPSSSQSPDEVSSSQSPG